MPASASSTPPSLPHIEARFRDKIWRGDALGFSADPVVPSGFNELDRELPGGGWPVRNLTELLLPAEGVGEIRLLSQALGQITRSGKNILLVAPPHVPYMHAWESLGIDSRRIMIIRAYKPGERLWALEQAIRSTAFGVVIGWLPEVGQQMTRRLQIIARTSTCLVFLFRPKTAQAEPSAAPLRILLGSPVSTCGHGTHTLLLYLLKRRGIPAVLPVLITLSRTETLFDPVEPITPPLRHNAVDRPPLSHPLA